MTVHHPGSHLPFPVVIPSPRAIDRRSTSVAFNLKSRLESDGDAPMSTGRALSPALRLLACICRDQENAVRWCARVTHASAGGPHAGVHGSIFTCGASIARDSSRQPQCVSSRDVVVPFGWLIVPCSVVRACPWKGSTTSLKSRLFGDVAGGRRGA